MHCVSKAANTNNRKAGVTCVREAADTGVKEAKVFIGAKDPTSGADFVVLKTHFFTSLVPAVHVLQHWTNILQLNF